MKDSVRDTFGIPSMVVGAGFIAGVELEIESIRTGGNLPSGWQMTEDGSLRNEGREFISPPLGREQLVSHFNLIHGSIKHYDEWPAFSERTSIHVHVNCLDLTPEQVKSIVLWYALFEPVIFAMCSPTRRNNIHCVGLDQTVLCESYKRTLPLFVQKWSKYTALNLLPLKTQGTMEFRHMEGHNDPAKFADWLKVLENLWTFGQTTPLKKSTLDNDDVLFAFDTIFGGTPIHAIRGSVLELVSDNLIDVKLALV